MTTISTKFPVIHERDPEEIHTYVDLGARDVYINEIIDCDDALDARDFKLGSNLLKKRDMSKKISEYIWKYPPHPLLSPKQRQKQLKNNKLSNHQLREHHYEIGYDPSKRYNSTVRKDYPNHDLNEYNKNKKNIKAIGTVTGPNNWYRSPNDVNDWKSNIKSTSHKDYGKKPLTQLHNLKNKQKKKNNKVNYQLGTDPIDWAPTRKSAPPTKSIADRKKEKENINRQKKILSQSSVLPPTGSMLRYKTEYQRGVAKGKPISAQEKSQIKAKMQQSGITLGSDSKTDVTTYRIGYRDINKHKTEFNDCCKTNMYYRGGRRHVLRNMTHTITTPIQPAPSSEKIPVYQSTGFVSNGRLSPLNHTPTLDQKIPIRSQSHLGFSEKVPIPKSSGFVNPGRLSPLSNRTQSFLPSTYRSSSLSSQSRTAHTSSL